MKGKIISKKKGETTYILYQYGSEYHPDKQYAVPLRTIVGKVSPADSSLMFPNEKFQVYFPDAEIPDVLPFAYRSCCLKIGSCVIIRKVLDEYKLVPMLRKRFGDDTGLILDLVSYLIVDEENAGQYYPDFAFTHPLYSEKMTIYSDSKVSRLLKSITKDQCIGFLDDWNQNRDHRSRIYISYDSTNKNCEAGDIDIVEFGKAKDDKGLPVFNLSIAMDKSNRVPLFYEEYPGSVADVSQLTFMVDKVMEYNYKKIGFILDRGYFSKENIQYIDENDYTFIIMCKGCKALVSSLILEKQGTFETKRESAIRAYKVYGTTTAAKLYEDDTKERYFHIFYNPSRQAAEREHLEQRIEKFRQFLDKHIGKEAKFGKTYQEYFHLHYDRKGHFQGADERTDVIERQLQLCGYFCIITSEKMTATQALVQYKGRDISEKLFRSDKTFIGSQSERVHSSESMSSKIFLEFIALIVRNRIYNLLKEQMIRLETRQKYMTVPAAIRELEKIEMVRRNNNTYKLDHAVTKTQKIILSSFGLGDADIRKNAEEYSRLLSVAQAFESKEEPDNGEEEID
ncbi:IS1634 family transposase [Clostridium vitabionis]|uniref:IS1634 family transposase n=1 Tax=Clostridium vitabionis TaxID=2784388 RepID=UPI001F3D28D7|nr:transposase [Clostridium vitabionis]